MRLSELEAERADMTKAEFQPFALEVARKQAAGTATLEDLHRFFAEMPPELQATAKAHGAPCGPEEIAEMEQGLAFLKWISEDQVSPEASQYRAILRSTGWLPGMLEAFINSICAVRAAKAGLAVLPPEKADAFAAVIERLHRQEGAGKEFAGMAEDLIGAALRSDDPKTERRMGRLLGTEPDLPASPKLNHFELGSVQTFLLENWSHIIGWEPVFGLCDFSRAALLDYVRARLDSDKKPAREYTLEAIEGMRKRYGLNRRLPARVESVAARSIAAKRTKDDQVVLVLRGGQKEVHRLSTVS